jgi:hypothetical protein
MTSQLAAQLGCLPANKKKLNLQLIKDEMMMKKIADWFLISLSRFFCLQQYPENSER